MARKMLSITKDVKPGRGVIMSRVKIPDKGKIGLTPKAQRFASFEGTLHGWRKDQSDMVRRQAVMKTVRADGPNTAKKKLVQLANITTDKDTERLARRDFEWLRMHYPPKSR